MNDLQIKQFELKLRAAFKPKCEITVWPIVRGHILSYEIRCGRDRYWQDDFLVNSLTTTYDIEVNVQAIANALPRKLVRFTHSQTVERM